MSFLTEITARRMATISRTAITTSVPRASFSTTIQLRKTPVEATKDTLKTVDRTVSDKLVDGINIASALDPTHYTLFHELVMSTPQAIKNCQKID